MSSNAADSASPHAAPDAAVAPPSGEAAREAAYAARLLRYQPQLGPHLRDDDVTEIRVNPHDGGLWVETRSGGSRFTGERVEAGRVRAFLNAVADRQGEALAGGLAHVQAQLPLAHFGGARLQGLLPGLVEAPCYVLRKRPAALVPLDRYVADGTMTAAERGAIERAVAGRASVLVAGGTGSGKTTLVGAILQAMIDRDPGERFVLLEDTPELRCPAGDRLEMRTGPGVDLAALVKLTLRASPDRIIVGEVRDGAALHLMDAWVTGHPGGAGNRPRHDGAGGAPPHGPAGAAGRPRRPPLARRRGGGARRRGRAGRPGPPPRDRPRPRGRRARRAGPLRPHRRRYGGAAPSPARGRPGAVPAAVAEGARSGQASPAARLLKRQRKKRSARRRTPSSPKAPLVPR